MVRWGMVIDLAKCTACQACVVACQVENNIPPSNPKLAAQYRSIHWIRMVEYREGEYPHVRIRLIPRPCMHCEHPPCVKVCPVGATNIGSEGIVDQIYPRCIGCRYCTTACPYTVKSMNWYRPYWPQELHQAFNPDVTIRPKGVVEKCTFCSHRLEKAREKVKAEGRILTAQDYVPACVETCPSKAMYFGDLDDPNSEVFQLARSPRAFRLMEDLGTEPKVFYLSEGV